MKDLGIRLQQIRKQFSLTQQSIAEIMGVKDGSSFRGCEKGTNTPPITGLIRLANHLSISLDYLAGLSTELSVKEVPDDEIRLLKAYYSLPDKNREQAIRIIEALK